MPQDKNKEKILTALISTTSIKDAAEKAKVSQATIYRYLADDRFNMEYRKARHHVVENTVGQIQGASEQAVETLTRNLSCGNPSVEVRAAQIILENTYKGVEILDLGARLEILEAEQEKMNEAIKE